MKLRVLSLIVLSLSIIWIMPNAYAQEKDKDYIPTRNTAPDAKPDPKTQGPKEKKIRYIITNDTKNTLAGNKCFEESTRKMGFLYMAVPKGQLPNYDGVTRWFHNFGVKFVLVFKNGPFWKRTVNKKFEECKFNSGDFVG